MFFADSYFLRSPSPSPSPTEGEGRCEKIQDSKTERGDIGKNVERLPLSVSHTKPQMLWEIDNLEGLFTIKLNVRILHFWRYSPVRSPALE